MGISVYQSCRQKKTQGHPQAQLTSAPGKALIELMGEAEAAQAKHYTLHGRLEQSHLSGYFAPGGSCMLAQMEILSGHTQSSLSAREAVLPQGKSQVLQKYGRT